ncbi:MAG: DUF3500 domain-containing protein [Chloroflexota bacterium]
MTTTDTLQARMAQQAMTVLDMLDADQRAKVQYASVDDPEREFVFYTPTDHGGLRMQHMTSPQHREVLRLVASGLSAGGFVTTAMIMAMENILDATEGWIWPLRDNGMRIRDSLAYALSIFGDPSGSAPWGWRFGGHHVSLNYLVTPQGVRSLPSFFGTDRAITPATGANVMRPLAAEEDLGRALIHLLTPEQRRIAVLSPVAPPDLVTSNRPRVSDGDRPRSFAEIWRGGATMNPNQAGFRQLVEYLGLTEEHLALTEYTTAPKGLPFAQMTSPQQDATRALLGQYIARMPDEVVADETARLDAALASLHFAWAGGIEAGEPHYYRVQGDTLLVEYDNTQSRANHIHTVWRDPRTDFGRDILAEHYAQAH